MQKVNYISQLTEAISRFSDDERLNSTHVSLYLALFQFWNLNRFKNPISINRSDAMRVSKVGSKTTYHRCINQLDEWGYIKYFPSNNPLRGSLVKMIEFQSTENVKQSNKTQLSTTCPKEGQLAGQVQGQVLGQVEGQVLVPSTNSIKHIVNNNKQYKTKEGEEKNSSPHPSQNKNDESSFRKDDLQSSDSSDTPKKTSPTKRKKFIPPNLQEVKTFFHENKSSYQVAEMFFNHFESNGWKVGGKAPMKNWNAAARNWIMRDEKYQAQNRSPAQQRLHVNENKDYSEPL